MIKLVFLTNLIVIVVCFITGTLFLVLPKKQLHHYKNSLKILSVAYYLLGILNSLYLFNLSDNHVYFYLQFINIFLTSSQIVLFSLTIIILYSNTLINRRFILRHSFPIVAISLLYFFGTYFWGTIYLKSLHQLISNIYHPSVILRIIFVLYCIFQIVYFIKVFYVEESSYEKQFQDNSSISIKTKQKKIKSAFYSALFVGILSLFYQFFAVEIFDIAFSLIIAGFYFVFGIHYIHFSDFFEENVNVLNQKPEIVELEVEPTKNKQKWNELKNAIITEKYYLEEGLTLENLALKLKTGRTILSNFINAEEGMNFNTWINTLRIEEAKRLFSKNKEYNIAEIAARTGFSEQSNFSRQFKQLTGHTPRDWKKKIEIEKHK